LASSSGVPARCFVRHAGLRAYVSGLAEALRVSRQTFNELLRERRAVSPEMALRLSRLFRNSPEFWPNAQHLSLNLFAVRRNGKRISVLCRQILHSPARSVRIFFFDLLGFARVVPALAPLVAPAAINALAPLVRMNFLRVISLAPPSGDDTTTSVGRKEGPLGRTDQADERTGRLGSSLDRAMTSLAGICHR
jgi:addiction module HigA family antidote